MSPKSKNYIRPACELDFLDLEISLLAESVNDNSIVSSVGQEIGVDVTFESTDFVNTTWETGIN